MPRSHKRQLGSRTYRNYSLETLQEAVEEVRNRKISLRKAEEKYNIHRNTIWNKLKGKNDALVGRPTRLLAEEEKSIIAHLIAMSSYGFPMTTFDLRLVVKSYLSRVGKVIPSFKNNVPGKDWASSFLIRHKTYLSQRMAKNISHNRAATNEEVLNSFYSNFRKECEGVPAENMWNYDETNLVDDPGSKLVITRRGAKYPERIRNSSKACTSIMSCANAAGTLAPLYVNYKADHIWSTWTENGPPNARYNRTPSGWFDFPTFEDWFLQLMLPILRKQPGKKILIGDNLSSHLNVTVLQQCEKYNIAFVCLPPNATHLLQPLDVAVFRPMKEAWRHVLGIWKDSPGGSRCISVPKDTFPSLLKLLLEKMEPNLASNIKAGFRKTGLYPFNPQMALQRLPSRVLGEISSAFDCSSLISETFIQQLEEKRNQITQPLRKRRKKLTVAPGKSVTAADVTKPTDNNNNASATKKKGTAKQKRKATQVENRQLVDSEITPQSSANQDLLNSPDPEPSTSSGIGRSCNRRAVPVEDDASSCSDFSIPYEESDKEFNISSDESDFGEATHEVEPCDTMEHQATSSRDKASSAENPVNPKGDFMVGDYVIVSYGGELFPGEITAISPSEFTVKAMERKGRHWVWPARLDQLQYTMEEIVLKIDKPCQTSSSRLIYCVPELEKMLL